MDTLDIYLKGLYYRLPWYLCFTCLPCLLTNECNVESEHVATQGKQIVSSITLTSCMSAISSCSYVLDK